MRIEMDTKKAGFVMANNIFETKKALPGKSEKNLPTCVPWSGEGSG
jgi:hypothetical protein